MEAIAEPLSMKPLLKRPTTFSAHARQRHQLRVSLKGRAHGVRMRKWKRRDSFISALVPMIAVVLVAAN